MTCRRTARFKREFQLLPTDIKRAARAKFALFSGNWRHPSLRVHKLEGVLWHGRQVFDLWVTDKYRALFILDHDVVVSLDWPAQHRVEVALALFAYWACCADFRRRF